MAAEQRWGGRQGRQLRGDGEVGGLVCTQVPQKPVSEQKAEKKSTVLLLRHHVSSSPNHPSELLIAECSRVGVHTRVHKPLFAFLVFIFHRSNLWGPSQRT